MVNGSYGVELPPVKNVRKISMMKKVSTAMSASFVGEPCQSRAVERRVSKVGVTGIEGGGWGDRARLQKGTTDGRHKAGEVGE